MPENTPPRARIAFLGAGNISGPYAESVKRHDELELIGVFDVDHEKAIQFAEEQGVAAYPTLDALCDAQPTVVVNLSSAPFHYGTTLDLIDRDQVVFSEKPLALDYPEARQLALRAAARGLRLACAPSLWLGQAQLRAASEIAAGAIGHVGLVKAEVNQGRIETWHPAPASFYQVGPVVDAGVYPITFLTAVLGPLREVTAVSSTSVKERETLGGEPFSPATDDTWAIIGSFESGALLSLTCNFFVDSATQPRTVTFHGSQGSLVLDDWFSPGASIREAQYGTELSIRYAEEEIPADWSLGVLDLWAAIRDDRPHRTSAEHAAHVVEVLNAIQTSATEGGRVAVTSSFALPDLSLESPTK